MDKTAYRRALDMALMFEKQGDFKNMEAWLDKAASLERRYGLPPRKEDEIALGAAFLSCINESIQSVRSGRIPGAGLGRTVAVRTTGCQLSPRDSDLMNAAVEMALNKALDAISSNDATRKKEIIGELWPGPGCIVVSLSLSAEGKFVWRLDLE